MDRANFKLTPLSKAFLVVVILGTSGFVAQQKGVWSKLFPPRVVQASSVPPIATLPAFGDSSKGAPGCAQLPELKMDLWAWNAQQGLLLANGGAQSTAGSLMCEQNVNLRLLRQDDPSKMREDLIAFATALKSGDRHPKQGVAVVGIMGDGSAAFLEELNSALVKVGPEYRAKVFGSAGYSWGEDRFMGPAAWKKDAKASRGGVVAGVLRDGDWNIALKWLGENQLCNNPDEHTYDPDCLNWVSTPGYVEAAQAYVAGYCEEREVVEHVPGHPESSRGVGRKQKVCVDAVVTWTPGDVTVAREKGGLVSIVSTREYRGQMPHVFIGIDKWLKDNRPTVEGLLRATFAGGERVRGDAAAREQASVVSAEVYGEESPAYWARYFAGVTEVDKTGVAVELGGSRVNGLGDDLYLFGVRDDGTADVRGSLFGATYTVFGNIVVSQYPALVPHITSVDDVVDISYLAALAKTQRHGAAEAVKFEPRPVKEVVSRGNWDIAFETGSAKFTPQAQKQLEQLYAELAIAGGAAVELHGHTDAVGSSDANRALSEARAFALKRWLETRSSQTFPTGRVRIFAHGQDNPVAPNTTAEGRAQNRRVEVVLGTL
jgi:outer membrane protein OmpA-like peptidoglycan-associated protein